MFVPRGGRREEMKLDLAKSYGCMNAATHVI